MTEQNTCSISELQQQATQGDVQAQFDLAYCYACGAGIEVNRELALDWLTKAAELDLADAQLALGYYYIGDLLGLVNDEYGPEEFHKKIFKENGFRNPLYLAAFLNGFENADVELGFKWLLQAAEQDSAEAQYWLACCYDQGVGLEQCDELAFKWFKKAADQSYIEAFERVTHCYLEGKGVEKSYKCAYEYYEKAADQGKAGAKEWLDEQSVKFASINNLDNDEFAKNDGLACWWLTKAAEQGVAEAQYRLARRYFKGEGVKKDYEIGMKWLTEAAVENKHPAANQWLADAYLRLAFPYLVGKTGVEECYKFAFEWCTKEVDGGSAEASLCLGILYMLGKGVEQNDELAFGYFDKATDLCNYDDGYDEIFYIRDFYAGFRKGVIDATFFEELGRIFEEGIILNSGGKRIVFLPLLTLAIQLRNKDYALAKVFINDALANANSADRNFKSIYLIAIEQADELEKKNQELEEKNKALESEIKQKEDANHRMQRLVEQFTHSLGNVIFPDTIYQVAERLKNNPECRKDVLLLHEAYHSEIIIKLQGELLRQRYANTNPEKFRQFIRSCRRTLNDADNSKTIEDILDYAASRVTARFLNQHYAGLNSIRDKVLSKKNVGLNALKQKFEDDILLNKSLRPIAWVNQNLRPIQITEISPLWKKVFILSESHAEALLFGYFSEIMFNAFKYTDHDKDKFLTLIFDEKTINGKMYLSCSWENPVKDKAPSMLDTGKGLDAIQEDLKQLNDTENPEESLLITQQKNQFQVTLFFKKDLLVNELPRLKIKRKANVE